MKIYSLLLLFLLCVTSYAQQVRVVKSEDDNQALAKTLWGNDVQIVPRELIGKMDGVQISDGTIYVAINDNVAGTLTGLKIRKSTNNGLTWTAHYLALEPAIKYENLRILKGRSDSLYVFFQIGNQLNVWNIFTTTIRSTTIPNLQSWDVAITSSGTFYLFYEADNTIFRQTSTDYGNFLSLVRIVGTGAKPKVTKSLANDNLAVIYYNGTTPDITTREIDIVNYIETSPGVISPNLFLSPIPAGQDKSEIGVAVNQSRMWIVYTVRTGTSIDIVGMYSNDQGATFSSEINIAADPNVDEYWFDVKANNYGPADFDLIFYSDYLQTGTATNETDKICATVAVTGGFDTPQPISENYPYWSPNDFVPRIVELPFFSSRGDFGAIWTGFNGINSGLYWDEWGSTTSVDELNVVPTDFQLSQNYPNPFNPSTKISYQLPVGSFVTLKVYDLLGNEVATLVNEYQQAGSYNSQFSILNFQLGSGVYFYKLSAGNFVQTKKMILLK